MGRRLGHVSTPSERQATFLSDDSSDQRLVQLHERLPRGSQAAWRRSRLRNVVHDQCGAVEHKHTYIYVHTQERMSRRRRRRSVQLRKTCVVEFLSAKTIFGRAAPLTEATLVRRPGLRYQIRYSASVHVASHTSKYGL